MTVTLHLGDCVTWAREYSGEPFHALLCDPPYHLTTPVVGWETFKRDNKKGHAAGTIQRKTHGFMGKQWDGGDLAFDPATWEAFGRIMYPGAFGMAFASSRGWHRMAVAIEDAGLIIHPSIFGWAYGSGFPKATRVDTQIDREAGAEREVTDFAPNTKGRLSSIHRESQSLGPGWSGIQTAPATPLAAAFAGHRYGLQALKPALEPIIVFQKPYAGRPIDCITATGAGCLAIDASRIASNDGYEEQWEKPVHTNVSANVGTGKGTDYIGGNTRKVDLSEYKPSGRWPANFYLDAEAARRLDEQSGTLTSGTGAIRKTAPGLFGLGGDGQANVEYGDSGGASRFFFRVAEQLDDADPVRYCAKASRRERDEGLEGFELTLMNRDKAALTHAEDRQAASRNPHPTVKPLSLTRYLATLLLPPAEYAPRRLFVPFAGVASECIGAMQAGWEDVQGVELTDEYLPIARARVEHWQNKPEQMELLGD